MINAPTATPTATRPEDRFVEAFERLDGHTLNGSSARLQALRKEAIAQFARLGLPGPKAEAYKYTNVAKLLRHDYQIDFGGRDLTLAESDLEPYRIPGLNAHTAVLTNGHFRPDLSSLGDLPEGVHVMSLSEAAQRHGDLVDAHLAQYADPMDEAFAALNTAFLKDGLFVYVPKSAAVERPIEVFHINEADADRLLQPRLLVVAEENAQVTIVETGGILGEAQTFTNGLAEFAVGPRARVTHYRVQDDGTGASEIATLRAHQAKDSYFSTCTVTFSGATVRNNLSIVADGEHCESHLLGLVLADGQMHVDNHTFMDHAEPNCFSNELYKNVLSGKATGVFNGKVMVRRDAQQTNAYQSNKSVLLSDGAQMYSKPELEIYADDVRCSHGATTGQLDKEALFYLRSRGIPEAQAKALLLVAFARDVLDAITLEPLRTWLDDYVTQRFEAKVANP